MPTSSNATDQQDVPEGYKILPCERCGKPILTKVVNEWAAHWDCVVPKPVKPSAETVTLLQKVEQMNDDARQLIKMLVDVSRTSIHANIATCVSVHLEELAKSISKDEDGIHMCHWSPLPRDRAPALDVEQAG